MHEALLLPYSPGCSRFLSSEERIPRLAPIIFVVGIITNSPKLWSNLAYVPTFCLYVHQFRSRPISFHGKHRTACSRKRSHDEDLDTTAYRDVVGNRRPHWKDATEVCVEVARKTRRSVRLPTEAQWEWACRAGTATRYFYGTVNDRFGFRAAMDVE